MFIVFGIYEHINDTVCYGKLVPQQFRANMESVNDENSLLAMTACEFSNIQS
jgi:hypothetical protein